MSPQRQPLSVLLLLTLRATLVQVQPSEVTQLCRAGPAARLDPDNSEVLVDFAGGIGEDGFLCDPEFAPSDVIFHPGLQRLVIVSDKGQVAIVTLDGSMVHCFSPQPDQNPDRVDFEAVAYAEVTPDYIYVGIERGAQDGVAVIQAARLVTHDTTGEIVGITMSEEPRWEVEFPDGMVGNKGLEGLAFVPDTSAAEGGSFVLGDQTAKEMRGGCLVPIITLQGCGDASNRCTCTGAVVKPEGWHEVSSISYTRDLILAGSTGSDFASALLLGSDDDNKLMAVHPVTGELLDWTLKLPKSSINGQEGIALLGCHLYIATDEDLEDQRLQRFALLPCACEGDTTTQQDPSVHKTSAEPTWSDAAGSESPRVFINEFLARSVDGIPGPDGTDADWIELYNAEDTPLDIGGWRIHDADMIAKGKFGYIFRNKTVMGARSYLVLIADSSGEGTANERGHVHLPFKLSSEDGIFLYDTVGRRADWLVYGEGKGARSDTDLKMSHGSKLYFNTTIPYMDASQGRQNTNVVWGRLPDGSEQWGQIGADSSGTPGASNTRGVTAPQIEIGAPLLPKAPEHVHDSGEDARPEMYTETSSSEPEYGYMRYKEKRDTATLSTRPPFYTQVYTWIILGSILSAAGMFWVAKQYNWIRLGFTPDDAQALAYTEVGEVQLFDLSNKPEDSFLDEL